MTAQQPLRARFFDASIGPAIVHRKEPGFCALSGHRSHVVVLIALARDERAASAHGGDDVMNCLAGGGVGLVLMSESSVAFACRWRLLVDSVAMWSCFDCHCSSVFSSSAVRTISGLPLRLVRADACCIDVFATAYSSTELARCRAVEELARASSRERGGRVV